MYKSRTDVSISDQEAEDLFLKALFEDADLDKNGMLDYEEFVIFMSKYMT